MTTTLLVDGCIRRSPARAHSGWVLLEGARIKATGRSRDAPQADRTIELDGATLIPAFCDAHVHLSATGLYESGLDLCGETSSARILSRLAERAGSTTEILLAGNLEDRLDERLTRERLDAVVGAKPALVARSDLHSCVVSSALLGALDLDDLVGVDRDREGKPTGWLREHAASAAWRWLDRSLSPQQQQDAVKAAARRAYSKGVAEVHEMFVLSWRGWESLGGLVQTAARLALNVEVYVATDDVERVVDAGFKRIGGDFFLDGSLGSYTAWLSEPYACTPPSGSSPTGVAYTSDEDLFAFFSRAHGAGLQTAVHAIGDAAIEQAVSTWERVAEQVGAAAVRGRGHRIEHFECSSDEHFARAAGLGLRASVQPAFDRYWGGREGLYAARIGWTRASTMNRFRSMLAAGLVVGASSDSTVTRLDPFLQIASLREHHLEQEALDAMNAFSLHTRGSYSLARHGVSKGEIRAGKCADLALLDRDPVRSPPEDLLSTEVLGTWIGGKRVWPQGEAESD